MGKQRNKANAKRPKTAANFKYDLIEPLVERASCTLKDELRKLCDHDAREEWGPEEIRTLINELREGCGHHAIEEWADVDTEEFRMLTCSIHQVIDIEHRLGGCLRHLDPSFSGAELVLRVLRGARNDDSLLDKLVRIRMAAAIAIGFRAIASVFDAVVIKEDERTIP